MRRGRGVRRGYKWSWGGGGNFEAKTERQMDPGRNMDVRRDELLYGETWI